MFKNTFIYKFFQIYIISLLTMSVNTFAETVSLTNDQIKEFDLIESSDPTSFAMTGFENGVQMLTFFTDALGNVSADIGKINAGYNWNDKNTYIQTIKNYDENASWFFTLSVMSGGTTVSSDTIELTEKDTLGDEADFYVDLSPLAVKNPIDQVYITLAADLTLPGHDTVAEYNVKFSVASVTEVPLPPAFILYFLGISSILIFNRFKTS